MSEFQAAGDMVSGALLGRAVEPRAGETPHGAHPAMCLNCGTGLIGPHCHQCGQAGHVHRTLMSIGHDLLHGVFHFEGKIWNTLPMLVTHPGALTRRYIDGERARFVSPLALFLFAVFLMFATFHSIGGGEFEMNSTPAARQEGVAKIDGKIAKVRAKLAAAQARKAKGGVAADGADDEIQGYQTTLTSLDLARRTIAVSADGHVRVVTVAEANTGWPTLDRAIANVKRNPDLAMYKLQTAAYKYSWALIPISVPFVALLFLWRRRFKLYDHAIFVTYSLSFMMLLVTAITLLATLHVTGWIWGPMIAFAPPVHMFFQLRGAYLLGTFSALWRTCVLLVFASITLVLFSVLLFALGLMG